MNRWLRNALLTAVGGGFMFGLVLAANPEHYGAAASLGGWVLSAGMVAAAIHAYRAG